MDAMKNNPFSEVSGADSSDEVLSAAIVGTWVSRFPRLGGGETTYFMDGHAAASVYADSPDLIPSKAYIKGSWTISDGRLITKVSETDPPGVLPVGHTSVCRIESLNVEELVLVTEDQTRLIERRRPNPPKEHIEAPKHEVTVPSD